MDDVIAADVASEVEGSVNVGLAKSAVGVVREDFGIMLRSHAHSGSEAEVAIEACSINRMAEKLTTACDP